MYQEISMKAKMGVLFLVLFLAFTARSWATTLPDACGPDKVQFDVKAQKNQPPPGPPAPGVAQIVFVENFRQNLGTCIDCKVTTRVGIDGAWVGADHGDSWFADSVQPGEHHLCVDWQSSIGKVRQKVGLAALAAEPGKVYYYEIKVREIANDGAFTYWLDLAPLDEDQGKYLVKIEPLAAATRKK
jgi:hypothetical protein